MTEAENLEASLRPDMNWVYAVPSMNKDAEFVGFGYGDEKILKAVITPMERAVLIDINFMLRQFANLSLFYGLHDPITAWTEELIAAEMAEDQALARANYTVAILVSGMADFSHNLNEHLGRIPEEEPTVVIPASPMHIFGIYFCATTLKQFLFPRVEEAGALFFGSLEELKPVVERLVNLFAKAKEDFSGLAHPALNLNQQIVTS